MWLLCTALTAQLAVVSQRKIFHCKDDLVKRPYVPHAPREPVYVYSLPKTFIQGRGERLDYRKNHGWSSPITLHPSVHSSGLVHPSTTLQPTASYKLSPIASQQTSGSLCRLVAGSEHSKGKFSARALLPHIVELDPQNIGWNKVKQD